MLRLAITTDGVPPPPAEHGFGGTTSVGAVFLAVQDLLDDPEGHEPLLQLPQGIVEDRIISHWWRVGAVQGRFFTPRNGDIYWRLLEELPRAVDADEAMALDLRIECATGLRIEEFVALGYAILSGVWRGNPLSEAAVVGIQDPMQWLRTSRLGESKKRAFLDLNSAPVEKLRRHAATPIESRAFRYDFGWLEKWPLIDLGDGRFIAPSVELVFRRISRGLYPLLLNRANPDVALHRRIQERRARATERFVCDALREAGAGLRRVLPAERYRNGQGDEVESGDAIAFFPDSKILVVAEVKSGQANHAQRPIGSAEDLFVEGSDLDRALRTLSRITADAHAPDDSRYPIDKIGARLWTRIVPLIVTDVALFHDTFLRRRLDKEATARGLCATEFVGPVGIVSFAEIDQLCDDALREYDVARLLDSWLLDDKARCVSLHRFVHGLGIKSHLDHARSPGSFPPPRVKEVLDVEPESQGSEGTGDGVS